MLFNPLSAKLIKWPDTLKQFVGNLPTNCLSLFGHFVGLTLKGLTFPRFCFVSTNSASYKLQESMTILYPLMFNLGRSLGKTSSLGDISSYHKSAYKSAYSERQGMHGV